MHLPRLRGPDSEAVSPLATLVRAPNPGPMTLDGTNSYVLRHPTSQGVIVVDPGPSIAEHLEHLAAFGTVELVLLTHHHPDHSEALHVTERFTPISKDAIQYEATMEDPNVFTRPWKISMPLYRRLEPNAQLVEYRCIEFTEEFMYGGLRRKPLVTRWEGETMIVDIKRKVPEGDKLYEWYRR